MEVETDKGQKNSQAATRSANAQKTEALTQILQTKGIEVQQKVEYEVSLALDNYSIAIRRLRKSVFKDFKDIKQRIVKSRKDAHSRTQGEIQALKVAINDESKKKIKEVQFMITTTPDFPLRTRHYIPTTTNIRVDTSSTYTLFNLCAFQEMSKPMNESTHKSLIRQQVRGVAEKEIKQLDQHRVNFVCQYLANKVSDNYMTMIILAKIINKPPSSLTKFWFKITQKPLPAQPNKIFAYKNSQYFCTICCKYVCNLHYEEASEDPLAAQNTDPDYEYSPFVTRYLVAHAKDYREEEDKGTNGKKRKDDDDIGDRYHLLYKCPRKIQHECCLRKPRSQSEIENFNVAQFQEHEKEFILGYCLKYGLTNPCVIRFMLGSRQKCWEIEAFLNRNPYKPRNIYPEELIRQAKADRRNEVKAKKKKNEPANSSWKHYVPCYHPGEACGDLCPCREIGNCEIFCGCTKDCAIRFQGCSCKPGKCTDINSCACLKNNRECNPELCKGCRCEIDFKLAKKRKLKTPVCPNTVILYKHRPRLLLGKSSICDGMGIFAGQSFEKGDFVGEYVGEMIEYFEGDLRGIIYNDLGCSYMFDYEEENVSESYLFSLLIMFCRHWIRISMGIS